MNSICPFDIQQVNSDVFLTYLLTHKKAGNKYYSYSSYDSKKSAFMHLISESGQVLDEKEKKAMSKMMKGLKKTIAKKLAETGERVMEGKEHMSFKCYQETCKLLIKDGLPDSVFALCF